MGFWRQKKHGSYEIPKISTGAKPKISIRCKPNIFVLFKSPKILTSKSRPWVLASKTWFLWNSPRFWQVFYLKFQHNVGPKSLFSLKKTWFLWNNWRFWQLLKLEFGYDVGPISLYSLKNPKILTNHTGNVFLMSKTRFLRNIPRFDRCLTWNVDTM